MEGSVFVSRGHMAVRIWCAMLAVALISAAATAGAEKKVIVAMEALVNCQDCASVGTLNLGKARPLPGARVVVTCRDHRGRVVLYQVGKADDNGYVFAELYTTTMRGGYFDPAESCGARLLTSPDERCGTATDVNGGGSGVAPPVSEHHRPGAVRRHRRLRSRAVGLPAA
ncbi:uncharacterized protein LOC122050399 [Zingiber officinale]|uniref:uncharacterized protein LOC122050399 n=1 Tax=Zingiber officinale TaxID=94328 RepID=UPI001C4B7D83|nr:uncharacterized protein LOC122050399 [Zingiber officinale]